MHHALAIRPANGSSPPSPRVHQQCITHFACLQSRATADHTTLLLNCYTKLKDVAKLEAFLHGSGAASGQLQFDTETAVKVQTQPFLMHTRHPGHACCIGRDAAIAFVSIPASIMASAASFLVHFMSPGVLLSTCDFSFCEELHRRDCSTAVAEHVCLLATPRPVPLLQACAAARHASQPTASSSRPWHVLTCLHMCMSAGLQGGRLL